VSDFDKEAFFGDRWDDLTERKKRVIEIENQEERMAEWRKLTQEERDERRIHFIVTMKQSDDRLRMIRRQLHITIGECVAFVCFVVFEIWRHFG